MSALLSNIAAAFITLPLLGYIIIFVITKQASKQHRRAVKMAIDGSALLFVISVHYLIVVIWGKSLIWLILALLILIGAAVTVAHWKFRGEISFPKVFRAFWRLTFLVFSFAYLSLLLVGLLKSIGMAL